MRTLYNLNQIYFVDDNYKDQRWILLFIWFIFKIKTLAEFLKMSMEGAANQENSINFDNN